MGCCNIWQLYRLGKGRAQRLSHPVSHIQACWTRLGVVRRDTVATGSEGMVATDSESMLHVEGTAAMPRGGRVARHGKSKLVGGTVAAPCKGTVATHYVG